MNRQGATEDAKNASHIDFNEPPARVDAIARNVIGAAIEVHRHLGPGFVESVYEEALAVEFGLRGIAFARQVSIDVGYKGALVGQSRLDLLVEGVLIVELKAVECFAPIHVAQALSYLKATRHPLALLITFNVRELRRGVRRVIHTRQEQTAKIAKK